MTLEDKTILLNITIRHLEEEITESAARKKSVKFLTKLAPNHKLSGDDLLRLNGAVPAYTPLLTVEDLNILQQLGLIRTFDISSKKSSQRLLSRLKTLRHELHYLKCL